MTQQRKSYKRFAARKPKHYFDAYDTKMYVYTLTIQIGNKATTQVISLQINNNTFGKKPRTGHELVLNVRAT